jgi:hypothetical protein
LVSADGNVRRARSPIASLTRRAINFSSTASSRVVTIRTRICERGLTNPRPM